MNLRQRVFHALNKRQPLTLLSSVLTAVLMAVLLAATAHADDNVIKYLAVENGDHITFRQPHMDDLLKKIGTRGRNNRRLAVCYTYNYMDCDDSSPLSSKINALKDKLKLAEDNDVPIIIRLDGVNWWKRRPDLWNWWDQSKPGYNPENIHNVERYGWNMDTAVKICWRIWGAVPPTRVEPQPNMGSKAVREAHAEALNVIMPVIMEWYNKLPADRKYLLGGLVLGWELAPYVGAAFFENGNDYLDKPPANDPSPVYTPKTGNMLALGYAAAQDLGLQNEGVITTQTLDAICRSFFIFMIDIAMDHGMDPKKIIVHTVHSGFLTKEASGWLDYENGVGWHGGMGAIIPGEKYKDVLPGWSLSTLNYNFEKPSLCGLLIDSLQGRPWAGIEVAGGFASTQVVGAEFIDLIDYMLGYKNNRYLNIVGWGQIADRSEIHSAMRAWLTGSGSVSVGAQKGGLTAGTPGYATFPVTTTEIINGTAIELNNINSVAGITLGTTVTTGGSTTLTIGTTEETPLGAHPLTITIDGMTSNSFNLVVINKVSLDDMKYYPNPIQPSKGPNYSKMQFSNIPPETRIKIYTMLGQIVRELKADASGTAVWDGNNNAGEKTASGVYIVYMEDGAGNKKRIKIAVER
ncbi:MAG: T9SS type A sorting domain-containing protein [Endomicrobia bacterium]|nr:T9SS type A sorting domain-containing protein [Endomicrobiia bacterium]